MTHVSVTAPSVPAAARPALRAGTEIDYAGMRAVVVHDSGGGRVTVRCEGHTQNWRWTFEGESCTVVKEPVGQLFYDDFDSYVAAFPAGESFRAWATASGHQQPFLLLMTEGGSPHNGLPGNYLWGCLRFSTASWRLTLHDCDDGLVFRDWPAAEESLALETVAKMKLLAPFSMGEANEFFGLNWA